jgi:hypothetical protein
VSNHRILLSQQSPKPPSNLIFTNVRQTKAPFILTCRISYPMLTNLYFSHSSAVYLTSHMTSSHTLLFLLATIMTFSVDYQMLLTSNLMFTFFITIFQKLMSIHLNKVYNISQRLYN